ncbi:hypothetical protein LINPERHAP2_LOCUS12830, partial [Linum perenne]
VYTSYISGHGLISTPSLHLVVGRFPFTTTSTLELVGRGLCRTTTLRFKQCFLFYLLNLLLPLIASHVFRGHCNDHLGFNLPQQHFPPKIRFLRVLQVEHY